MHRITGTGALGPLASMALVSLWLEKKVELTEDEFDELCEGIIDALGEARDERYRLKRD